MTHSNNRVDRERIVVVGLGGIGGGIAGHLADGGRPIVGVDVDATRASAWKSATGSPAVSSFDDVDWADVRTVVVAVRTAPQVEAVLSDVGVHSALSGGGCGFVITTLTPTSARGIIDAHRELRLFELPVSGGEVRARRGELTGLLAGPPPDLFETALLREVFGELFTFEDFGQPSLLKLINNSLAARNALGTAVALATAHREGVDISLARDAIHASSGSSVAGDALSTLTDNQVDLLVKDARLLREELGESPFEGASLDGIADLVEAARTLLTDSNGDRTQ